MRCVRGALSVLACDMVRWRAKRIGCRGSSCGEKEASLDRVLLWLVCAGVLSGSQRTAAREASFIRFGSKKVVGYVLSMVRRRERPRWDAAPFQRVVAALLAFGEMVSPNRDRPSRAVGPCIGICFAPLPDLHWVAPDTH